MYLTARLIALSVYCMVLVGFCLSIAKIKYTRVQLFLYAVVLALMGFFFVPDSESDLTRIFPLFSRYASLSWGEVLLEVRHSSTPMSGIYYYFIGFLHNEHFLPAVNAFITFSFCFTMLYQACKKYALRNSLLALILFFFMSRGLLMMTIANIRTMLALAILAYCIYKEMLEGVSIFKHIPLLVVAALLHTMAVASLCIYLIFALCWNLKSSKTVFRWIQTGAVLALVSGGGFYYLQNSFAKGQHYIEKSMLGIGYFYIWELIISIGVLLLTIGIIGAFVTQKPWFKRQLSGLETQYLVFLSMLSGINLILFWVEFNMGLRLSWLVTLLDMPLFAMILSNKTLARERFLWIKYILFMASVLLLFLACARGHLCSLKFFEYL